MGFENILTMRMIFHLAGDEDDLDVDGGEGFEVYTWAGQTRVREGTI